MSSSDHSSLLLHPISGNSGRYKYKFRFENAWLKDPICIQIIKDSWEGGSNMDLFMKINTCSKSLAEWGVSITGGFGVK